MRPHSLGIEVVAHYASSFSSKSARNASLLRPSLLIRAGQRSPKAHLFPRASLQNMGAGPRSMMATILQKAKGLISV
jgi:hypothetical protein